MQRRRFVKAGLWLGPADAGLAIMRHGPELDASIPQGGQLSFDGGACAAKSLNKVGD